MYADDDTPGSVSMEDKTLSSHMASDKELKI